jgi:hypothetical protein
VTFHPTPGTAGQQPESLVQMLDDLPRRQGDDARRSQLDGEWDPVETAANLNDCRQIGRVDAEARNDRPGLLDEQPNRRRVLGRLVARLLAGDAERSQRPQLLAGDGKAFTTGRKDADARARRRDPATRS